MAFADQTGNKTPAAQMIQEAVLGNRKWPAHLTVDQMRAQINWEQECSLKAALEERRADRDCG